MDEMGEVSDMLDSAEQMGLEVEVILTFGKRMADGLSVQDAANAALQEWDI